MWGKLTKKFAKKRGFWDLEFLAVPNSQQLCVLLAALPPVTAV